MRNLQRRVARARVRLGGLVFVAGLVAGCSTPQLIKEHDKWYVKGLDSAPSVPRTSLFVVSRPMVDSHGVVKIAVFQALDASDLTNSLVLVTPLCVVPGEKVEPLMSAALVFGTAETRVGPCLSHVVEHQVEAGTGERFFELDIGSGDGLEPGDQLVLVGKPLFRSGYVSNPVGTIGDGRCQIPLSGDGLTKTAARCNAIKNPPPETQYAVLSDRLRPKDSDPGPVPPPPPESVWGRWGTRAILGAGMATLAVGGVYAAQAYFKRKDYESKPECQYDCPDLRAANAAADKATILGIAGLAVTAVGAALYYQPWSRGENKGNVRVMPAISGNDWRFTLEGRF